MKSIFALVCVLGLTVVAATSVLSETRLRMSTTTSTENSGLLKVSAASF